jgi:hypothetical protein
MQLMLRYFAFIIPAKYFYSVLAPWHEDKALYILCLVLDEDEFSAPGSRFLYP